MGKRTKLIRGGTKLFKKELQGGDVKKRAHRSRIQEVENELTTSVKYIRLFLIEITKVWILSNAVRQWQSTKGDQMSQLK